MAHWLLPVLLGVLGAVFAQDASKSTQALQQLQNSLPPCAV